MSYKDELKIFREEGAKHRKRLLLIIKLTVVVFAVFAVLTTVFLIADIVKDGGDTPVGSSSGDGSGAKAPTITLADGLDAIYVFKGENVSWKTKVKLSSGATLVSVDTSSVNLDTSGVYTVTYVAQNGKKTTSLSVTVVVSNQYSYEKLMELVKNQAAKLGITESMSVVEKVNKIYDFVNSPSKSKNEANIVFTDKSLTDRKNWETDWVEEAGIALEAIKKSGQSSSGDCYTYYSVSKAFFAYFEIENVGIQRDTSKSSDGTHFWSMVNVGTASKPQWYFYDATRLKSDFTYDGTKNACLITAEKLKSYKVAGFYAYDESKYPTPSSTPLK